MFIDQGGTEPWYYAPVPHTMSLPKPPAFNLRGTAS